MSPASACTEWFNQDIPHHLPSDFGFVGQDFAGHGDGHQEAHRLYCEERGLQYEPIKSSTCTGEWPRYQVVKGSVEASIDHFLVDHSLGLVDQFKDADQPFFIWHNHWGPHEAYLPMQEYYEMYKDLELEPWENYEVPEGLIHHVHDLERHPRWKEIGWDYWLAAIRHYYAFTTQIDAELGRLFQGLEDRGVLDNTIIIFSSDHGEALGSHGGMTNKGYSHFEEIQRVGMIIRYPEAHRPKGVELGKVVSEPVSLVDLYSTILDMAGEEHSELDAQGYSLHRRLSEPTGAWRTCSFVEFYGLHAGTTMITCRKGQHKFGWNANGPDELYDLSNDPAELDNLAERPEHRELCSALMLEIEQHLSYQGSHLVRQQRERYYR